MRILITNNTLSTRAGTELYVRDIAFRLREMGHEPVCFAMQQGSVAQELRGGGISVLSSLAASAGPFDLIHGHHRIETTLAGMAFPRTPVLSFCHGPRAWQESPAMLPNVVQYAAVDEACRDRFGKEGIPKEKIALLLNFADTRRFQKRSPLPDRPRNALVFSNAAHEGTHLPFVREACEPLGITVEVAGLSSGQATEKPEDLLPRFDLVFAKARAAIEAMTVGCAVIQCDYYGAGEMVTSARFDALRPLNFGYRSMPHPLSAEHLAGQIRRYDAQDAAAVTGRLRSECSLDDYMVNLVALYERVATVPVPAYDPWEAGAGFLEELTGNAKKYQDRLPLLEKSLQKATESQQALRQELDLALRHGRAVDEILHGEQNKTAALRQKNESLKSSALEVREINGRLKSALKSLNRKHRPWWKKLLPP